MIGAATGAFARNWLPWVPDYIAAAVGAGIGAVICGCTGKQIAIWSRRRAAELVLEGNRTVIQDIGKQSARFLELLQNGATNEHRAAKDSVDPSAIGLRCPNSRLCNHPAPFPFAGALAAPNQILLTDLCQTILYRRLPQFERAIGPTLTAVKAHQIPKEYSRDEVEEHPRRVGASERAQDSLGIRPEAK